MQAQAQALAIEAADDSEAAERANASQLVVAVSPYATQTEEELGAGDSRTEGLWREQTYAYYPAGKSDRESELERTLERALDDGAFSKSVRPHGAPCRRLPLRSRAACGWRPQALLDSHVGWINANVGGVCSVSTSIDCSLVQAGSNPFTAIAESMVADADGGAILGEQIAWLLQEKAAAMASAAVSARECAALRERVAFLEAARLADFADDCSSIGGPSRCATPPGWHPVVGYGDRTISAIAAIEIERFRTPDGNVLTDLNTPSMADADATVDRGAGGGRYLRWSLGGSGDTPRTVGMTPEMRWRRRIAAAGVAARSMEGTPGSMLRMSQNGMATPAGGRLPPPGPRGAATPGRLKSALSMPTQHNKENLLSNRQAVLEEISTAEEMPSESPLTGFR